MDREKPKALKGSAVSLKKASEFILLVSFAALPTSLSFGADSGAGISSGQTPLIREMGILDTAFREIVSAVAVGDWARVAMAIESMRGTMEKTHEGVHTGTVKIPRNAGREKEFVRFDRGFHRDLEKLGNAATANKKKKMLSLTKKLLDGCVRCHAIFK